MRRRTCARALAVIGLALAGYAGPLSPLTGSTGVSEAQAASFFTRKRVNGRWITGHFPKAESGGASTTRATRSSRRRPLAVAERDAAAPPMPPVRTGALRASVESVAAEFTDHAPGAPALDASPTQTASLQVPAEEPMLRLKRALQARADELLTAARATAAALPESVVAPAVLVPQSAGAPSGKMNAALAPTPGASSSIPPPLAAAQPAAARPVPTSSPGPAARATLGPLEPRSVSYDFETGIKTTVFESSVVREPFDVAALKGMTGRLPPLR